MGRRPVLWVVAGIVALAWWLAAASCLFLWVLGFWDLYPWPGKTIMWARYAIEAPANAIVQRWLIITGIVAAVPLLLIGGAIIARRSKRRHLVSPPGGGLKPQAPGVTSNHGHSQWRSMESARELFPGPNSVYGGVVVGEAYRVDQDATAKGRFKPHDRRTWGKGGKAPLLIDPCEDGAAGNHMVFAGTGGFKTVSAVATALHWTGSSVILDPSTELGPMLDGALRAQGKQVVHIGIRDDDTPRATGMDVLGWIDINDPEAEIHCRTVISWAYDDEAAVRTGKGGDQFFTPMGKDLATAILAHLLWTDDPDVPKTLATLATGIATPERDMMTLLTGIHATSNSLMARRIAGSLMQCSAPETMGGVILNAVAGLSWLFTRAYADMVSDPAFDPRDLLAGRTTVFLNISLRTLEHSSRLACVLVGALMNTVYMADGNLTGRVLFLLDEAARLGRMRTLETARDTGRKYGLTLSLQFQSVGQLAEAWGRDGARAWTDAMSWIGYASVRAGGAG